MFLLILANKKIYLRNRDFFILLSIKKDTIIISKVSSMKLSIFGHKFQCFGYKGLAS